MLTSAIACHKSNICMRSIRRSDLAGIRQYIVCPNMQSDLDNEILPLCTWIYSRVFKTFHLWHSVCSQRVTKHNNSQTNTIAHWMHQFQPKTGVEVEVKSKVLLQQNHKHALNNTETGTHWVYLPHTILASVALQWPHCGDNRVSMGASTETERSRQQRVTERKHIVEKHFTRSHRCDRRACSRHVPIQWKTSLPSKAISHWLHANLESVLL